MSDDRPVRVGGGVASAPAEPAPAEPAPKVAGQRLSWPTIWHADQLPFPWGGAKRLRKPRVKAEDECTSS